MEHLLPYDVRCVAAIAIYGGRRIRDLRYNMFRFGRSGVPHTTLYIPGIHENTNKNMKAVSVFYVYMYLVPGISYVALPIRPLKSALTESD